MLRTDLLATVSEPTEPTQPRARIEVAGSMAIVIDTNIWLDMLVFDDPGTRRLASLLRPHGVATGAARRTGTG